MNKKNIELVSKLGVIASRLSSISDIPTLASSMNDIVDSIIISKYNGLYLFDEELNKLVLHLAKNFTEEERIQAEKTAMKRHIGWVFNNDEVLLVNDTQKENSVSKDSKRSFKVRSRLWIPIKCLDKIVGVFGMASTKPNMYTKEHVALINFVCDLAGVVYNNITLENKQKKINESLIKSKEEFETLFESFPDAILIHDFNKITNVNSSFLELFSIDSKDTILGKLFIDDFLLESNQEIRNILTNRIQQKTTFIPQIRLLKNNGSVFLAEMHVLLINLANKAHIQLTIRDITERKLIEEKLRKEEQKSMLLKQAEQVPGIIYQARMQQDGKVSYPFVSGKMLNLFNKGSNETIDGKLNLFDNVFEEDQIIFEKTITKARLELKNWSLDYRVINPQKEIRWMRGNSKPVIMKDQSVVWHGYITDITEHKQAEEALLDSEKQISTMFEHAPDAILVIDSDGYINKWNPKAQEIFGWSEQEVIQTKITEIIVPNQFKKRLLKVMRRFIRQALSKNKKQTLEWTALHKNGHDFPIALSISDMILKDKQYFICFISDITKRKHNENKIKQSLVEKEVLLKEIHHRIKNNMQVITGLLSLQSSFIEQEKIKSLFMSSQYRIHSMGIVHEMLYQSDDVSKILFEDYLNQLAGGLIHAMKGTEQEINLEIICPKLTLNLDTAIPLGLITNELVTNSLKYGFNGRKKGTISIRLSIDKQDKEYKLYIGDDGVGYPKQFNFYSSKSLGLMLVHKLSRQLSGKIVRDFSKIGSNYVLYFKEII